MPALMDGGDVLESCACESGRDECVDSLDGSKRLEMVNFRHDTTLHLILTA